MQAFMTSLNNLMLTWQPLIWIAAAISLFACGVGCVIPSEEIRKFSRKALPWIVMGVGIALLSTTIAKEVSSTFTF